MKKLMHAFYVSVYTQAAWPDMTHKSALLDICCVQKCLTCTFHCVQVARSLCLLCAGMIIGLKGSKKKVRHAVCRGILRRKKLSKRLFDVVSEEKPCGDFCAVKSLQDLINIPAHDNIQ